MKVKQRLLSFLIAGFVIFHAISTFALNLNNVDEKIYPGTMGVKVYSGPDPVLSWGRIGNPSTLRNLYVDLPLINDMILGRIKSGSVDVIDRSSSSSIRCTLITVSIWGRGYHLTASPPRYSSDYSGWKQRMHFNVSRLPSDSFNSRYFSCRIPPRSKGQTSYINSYRLSEQDTIW
jgi:hypothetical protein